MLGFLYDWLIFTQILTESRETGQEWNNLKDEYKVISISICSWPVGQFWPNQMPRQNKTIKIDMMPLQ